MINTATSIEEAIQVAENLGTYDLYLEPDNGTGNGTCHCKSKSDLKRMMVFAMDANPGGRVTILAKPRL